MPSVRLLRATLLIVCLPMTSAMDKSAAIGEILGATDYVRFLERSGYGGDFGK